MSAIEKIHEIQMQPAATPAHLLQMAVSQGANLDQLEKLMQLQERWEANEARKAFVAAMALFKSEPILVSKSKTVDFTTQKGRTHYTHATLADVVDSAVSGMGKHGLSHRWDVEQVDGQITVTCAITHQMGHTETVRMSSRPDETGNKNAIQQIGSTVTYLQRYTLMSALGLAACDMQEDDGRGTSRQVETLNDEQQAQLQDLIDANGRDKSKFLQWAKVESLSDIPASWFEKCRTLLSQRKPDQGGDNA